MSLLKIKDTISPDLRAKALAVEKRGPLLQAMGTAVVSMGTRAFTDASLRPSTWAPRKQPDKPRPHAPLLLDNHLRDSLRTSNPTNKSITIQSDTPYAATHQLGSEKLHVPARPFLPFQEDGSLTPQGNLNVERALRAALKSKGIS